MTLVHGHDTPLVHGQQLCGILFRSNMAMRSYDPDTDFGYVCTVTLTSEIWPWVKVMTHPSVIDNKYEILFRFNLAVRNYGPDTDFGYVCPVTLNLEMWPWVKVMTHPSVIDNKCVKYYPDQNWQWGVMARKQISSICALWPWPWRYDLGSRLWHILRS